MYILFDTNGDPHIIEEEDELNLELLSLCFTWTHDSSYCGEMDYNALFNWCLEKHDFGDNAIIGFWLTKVGETVPLTRIY